MCLFAEAVLLTECSPRDSKYLLESDGARPIRATVFRRARSYAQLICVHESGGAPRIRRRKSLIDRNRSGKSATERPAMSVASPQRRRGWKSGGRRLKSGPSSSFFFDKGRRRTLVAASTIEGLQDHETTPYSGRWSARVRHALF